MQGYTSRLKNQTQLAFLDGQRVGDLLESADSLDLSSPCLVRPLNPIPVNMKQITKLHHDSLRFRSSQKPYSVG
jgi:hypothetical protein